MSDQHASAAEQPEIIHPGGPGGADGGADGGGEVGGEVAAVESVSSPAKVMRIGAMVKQLLDEVRAASLDEAGRERLKAIYEESIEQLSESLSADLGEELARLNPPFSGPTPSEAELRVAQAQLVGWLEGLFHGIQATLFAQQMAARQQLEQMRGQLPPGVGGQPGGPPTTDDGTVRPGTYL